MISDASAMVTCSNYESTYPGDNITFPSDDMTCLSEYITCPNNDTTCLSKDIKCSVTISHVKR